MDNFLSINKRWNVKKNDKIIVFSIYQIKNKTNKTQTKYNCTLSCRAQFVSVTLGYFIIQLMDIAKRRTFDRTTNKMQKYIIKVSRYPEIVCQVMLESSFSSVFCSSTSSLVLLRRQQALAICEKFFGTGI